MHGNVLFDSCESVELSCFELTAEGRANDLFNSGNENVVILEDVLGNVHVNTTRVVIESRKEYQKMIDLAWSLRKTSCTLKNLASSRSHAIFRLILFHKNENESCKQSGIIHFIDLAGSERASSDSNQHTKELMKQSIYINKSLMTLKDCIRQRSSVGQSQKHIHIPYRGSKLTLVLKVAFDIESRSPCHTLFIATVSSLIQDTSASINTLRYAGALVNTTPRIHKHVSNAHPNDVSYSTHGKLMAWFEEKLGKLFIKPEILFPDNENGYAMSKLPEPLFIDRLIGCCEPDKLGLKRARAVYLAFWTLVIKERTKSRGELQKNWKNHKERNNSEELEFLQDMIKRSL